MRRFALLLLIPVGAAYAQHDHAPTTAAAREWTRQPLLLPDTNRRGERATASLRPQGLAADKVTLYAPAGPAERRRVDYAVGAAGARIESATPQIGNYHWAVARVETPEAVRVASTAWYFGNPGPAPQALLGAAKHELEIVPEPLPREHAAYRESEKWRFLVRLNGVPLAQQPLTLETEFGSRSTFVSDATGMATVLFPRDFKPAQTTADARASHGPRRANFVLSTEKEDGGRRYQTAFNLTYGPDADRDRSLAWGAAFGLVGMLAATPLLRRRVAAPGDAKNA